MIQADVFYAYGSGASFALAAGLAARARPADRDRVSPPGAHPVPWLGPSLYFVLVFAPGATLLLLLFPGWETMYVVRGQLPVWLAPLSAAAYIGLGTLGGIVARRLLAWGLVRWAYLQMVAGYALTFFVFSYGWDGTGYRRALSASASDFVGWSTRSLLGHILAWLTSGVALSVGTVGALLVAAQLVMIERLFVRGLGATDRPGTGRQVTVRTARLRALLFLGGAVALALGLAVLAVALVGILGWLAGLALFGIIAGIGLGHPSGLASRLAPPIPPGL